MIAVGDFVLVESIVSSDMEFRIGEVVYVDEHVVVVKKDWQVTVERRAMIGFAGTRKQATALKVKVDVMLEERRKVRDAAQEQVYEIGGEHALAIRKLLKQKTDQRDKI